MLWEILGVGFVAFVAYCNLVLPEAEKATLEWLRDANLLEIGGNKVAIKGKDLWADANGALIMAVRRPG